jgi:hypothetical protein
MLVVLQRVRHSNAAPDWIIKLNPSRIAMSTNRELAVYDGTRHIGTIIERADRRCVARGASGRKIGTFPNVQKAADAISEVDKVFSNAISKKSA